MDENVINFTNIYGKCSCFNLIGLRILTKKKYNL